MFEVGKRYEFLGPNGSGSKCPFAGFIVEYRGGNEGRVCDLANSTADVRVGQIVTVKTESQWREVQS